MTNVGTASKENSDVSVEEIVRFLLPSGSRLEQEMRASPTCTLLTSADKQPIHHISKEEKCSVVKPIREVDRLNAYKSNNLAKTGREEIPSTVLPSTCKEDYNCAEYKVWFFNHLQSKSFWDDIKEAGLFD